jgi:hypothetical protein
VPKIPSGLPEGETVTSDKQTQANRRNALKSTGPTTPEGKAAASQNALTHGLLSREVLLPGEDGAALVELGGRLREELRPAGELEGLLVERVIAAAWRLRRLGRVEAGIFVWERLEELAERAEREARGYESSFLLDLVDDDAVISDEEKHEEALATARRMRSEQEEETALLGRTFARDADKANAFSKLSRYETTIERGLYRALHELQRLQAARGAGSGGPPPVAVDVDVSGVSGEGV